MAKHNNPIKNIKKKITSDTTNLVCEALKEGRSSDSLVSEDNKPKVEKKRVHELGKTLREIKIDMAQLQDWRDGNGMPAKCLLDVYKAVGLMQEAEAFKARTGLSVIPAMQITCTRRTFEVLKDFVITNWEWWPIDIVGDEKVVWLPGWEHAPRHCPHKIKAKIRNSLHYDFAGTSYAPFLDDDLDVDKDDMKIFFHDREATTQEEELLVKKDQDKK